MKTVILCVSILISGAGMAQISDSVSLGAGYTNESYYSLENGEVANVDNNNWDLAFDLSGYGATIKLNRRQSIMYVYPGSSSDWSTLDTSGIMSWDTYTDTYNYWNEGAFNNCADTSNGSDLGWGLYNSTTHFIDGERMFVIKLGTGDFKKLYFEQLASGTYTFKYANLDNSGEVNETIVKSDYTGKNFIHYSIENETVVDREPISTNWDIMFTNVVLELAPDYFGGVTYALHNKDVVVSEVSGVPSSSASYGTFEDQINTIGSDWKTFNMGLMEYEIEDSLTYFVQSVVGDVWKLVFTGFNGSSDGKIYFTKEKVEYASANEELQGDFNVFPNPANQFVTLQSQGKSIKSVNLFSISGQLVYSESFMGEYGTIEIPTDSFEEGIYILNVVNNENKQTTHKLIIKH